jgi:UPF0716 protein FxsA
MLALLLLILWPIVELIVAIKVAEAIGVALTVLLLIAGVPIGIWLTRAEGRAAWRRLRAAMAEGRPPGHEAINGALVLLGGIMLIVPGFISDAIGLCLLLAPTRSLARGLVARTVRSRVVVTTSGFSRSPGPAYDVDSTASDIDTPQLHG